MRVIIAGSRNIDPDRADAAVETMVTLFARTFEAPTVVMSGACRTGVDAAGERWAAKHGVPVERYPADWTRGGTMTLDRSAGPSRNRTMAQAADGLIAIWDGKSCGTKNMIAEAKRAGIGYLTCVVTPGPAEGQR